MENLVVRNIDDSVVKALKARAGLEGISAEAEHRKIIDKQIAATALMYNLCVVTRNTKDFEGTGVDIINPFT